MPKYNAASLISKIRDAFHKMIVSELEKQGIEGIVPTHGDILIFLYQQNGLSIKTLADKIGRTQPTVSVLVNKLESLGYVTRFKSHEDNRITLIHLTEKGMELEPVFQDISNHLNKTIYGGLSEEQRELFEQLLEHVVRRF